MPHGGTCHIRQKPKKKSRRYTAMIYHHHRVGLCLGFAQLHPFLPWHSPTLPKYHTSSEPKLKAKRFHSTTNCGKLSMGFVIKPMPKLRHWIVLPNVLQNLPHMGQMRICLCFAKLFCHFRINWVRLAAVELPNVDWYFSTLFSFTCQSFQWLDLKKFGFTIRKYLPVHTRDKFEFVELQKYTLQRLLLKKTYVFYK